MSTRREKLTREIHTKMEKKSTEELLKIWQENDREQWSEEVFEAIRQLLLERGEHLPPRPSPEKGRKKTNRRKDNIYKDIKAGRKWESHADFYKDLHESLLGKRDGWTYFYGLVTPIAVIFVALLELDSLTKYSLPERIVNSFYMYNCAMVATVGIICLSFFFGKRWARKLMYAIPFIGAGLFYVTVGYKINPDAASEIIGQKIGSSIIPLTIYYFATRSVSNKVFFHIPISEADLKKYWSNISNKTANASLLVGLFAPFLPIAAVIALGLQVKESKAVALGLNSIIVIVAIIGLILGIKAFKKVDLNSIPPVGGRNRAIFGAVVSSIWIAFVLVASILVLIKS